jgi:hypothetical protein
MLAEISEIIAPWATVKAVVKFAAKIIDGPLEGQDASEALVLAIRWVTIGAVSLSQICTLADVPTAAEKPSILATQTRVETAESAVSVVIAPWTILFFQIAWATVAFLEVVKPTTVAAVVIIEGPLLQLASLALVEATVRGTVVVSESHKLIV